MLKKTIAVNAGRQKSIVGVFASGLLAGTVMFVAPSVVDSVLHTGFTPAAMAQDDEEGRRPPPSTRSANTLTRAVYTRIEEVQTLRDEEMYTEALEVLAEVKDLYDRDRLNNYEKYMMYIFYASISLDMENDIEAMGYFESALQVPELSNDQLSQIYNSLSGLYAQQERFQDAIDILMQLLEIDPDPNNSVYLRVAYAYYQLEQYADAEPWILRNMAAEREDGNEVPKTTFDLLKSVYLIIEDYAKARQVSRELVVLFDEAPDWNTHAQIEAQLDNLNESGYTSWLTKQKGYFDRESQWINLAYQMYGAENPYGAALLMEEGLSSGVVEETADNYDFLSLLYQIAREDRKGIEPTLKALAIEPRGNLYMRLGQLYNNLQEYENAVQAYNDALDSDEVEREDQLLLMLANAYGELNRYDDAIDAARRAGRADNRSSDTASSAVRVYGLQKERYDTLQRQRRELAAFL